MSDTVPAFRPNASFSSLDRLTPPEPTETRRRGELRPMLDRYVGHVYVAVRRCDDCGTDFTSPSDRTEPTFTINRVANDGFCPWCREDSAPGRHGRGV